MSESPAMLSGDHRFSPAVCTYLEQHAVELDLAYKIGARSDRDAILYPYTTPKGETYNRRRDLGDPDKRTVQPKGEALILWWPAGRPGPGATVLLTEGEPDALAALTAREDANIAIAALPGVGIPTERITAELASANVVYLAFDGDKAGRDCADRCARALQNFTTIRILILGDGEDLASTLYGEDDRRGWLRDALATAPEAPKLATKAEPSGYGANRKADKLRDLRAKGIDPDKLDLAALLDDVVAFIRRYVFLGDAQATTIAMWIVHTHVLDASRVTPYLAISSAEPGCGKTLLLEVLEQVVLRPWLTGRTTAAVLPRKIEKVRPTLLLDESDAGFGGERDYAEALRGILNTGYKRSGKSTVCVGKGADIDFADFSTFCPKAISGLGKMPDTIRDRSLGIRLEKIAADEHVEEFEEEEAEEAGAGHLRDRLEAFALRGTEQLAGKRPDRPAGLSPRTREIIRPLLAIADLAGGEWPQRGRLALVKLAGEGEADEATIGVELLSDIRDVLDRREADRISTAELLEELHGMDERPWGEWRRGDPISNRGVAKLLRPYRIKSRTVRLEDGSTPKGLHREQLEDAFKRYIPQNPPSYPPQRHNGSTKPNAATSYPPQENAVADREPPQTARTSHCGVVADTGAVSPDNGAEPTLEDALLDPAQAERIRASVDGEWIDDRPLVLSHTEAIPFQQ